MPPTPMPLESSEYAGQRTPSLLTRGSVVTYLATPVAAALGVLFRDDVLEPVQVLGGALTLSGAWFASRADR